MKNRYPNDQWQEILGACDTTVFLGCNDSLTAEYFSDRTGVASVEIESEARDLNTMHITNYTPRFRKTNSISRRPLMTPDEIFRLPLDHVLIFIRGKNVLRAMRFDYSKHPEYKKLKSEKAILHEPEWKKLQEQQAPTSGSYHFAQPAPPIPDCAEEDQEKPTESEEQQPVIGRRIDDIETLFRERRD
jgi:type IV secretion system protein VirD4